VCYGVYISTDSSEDLSRQSSELVRFERVKDEGSHVCAKALDFENKWYVGSASGCSCTFRHLEWDEPEFGEPEEWFDEEADALAATGELYRAIGRLADRGYKVDLVDTWEGSTSPTGPEDVKVMGVSLEEVRESAFRLFLNYKFIFR
jgi:hypothetical protein